MSKGEKQIFPGVGPVNWPFCFASYTPSAVTDSWALFTSFTLRSKLFTGLLRWTSRAPADGAEDAGLVQEDALEKAGPVLYGAASST